MVKPTGKATVRKIKKRGEVIPVKTTVDKLGRTQFYAQGNRPLLDIRGSLLGIERDVSTISIQNTGGVVKTTRSSTIERNIPFSPKSQTIGNIFDMSAGRLPQTNTDVGRAIDKSIKGTNIKTVQQIGKPSSKGGRVTAQAEVDEKLFKNKFFSGAGQKERLTNVGRVGKVTGQNMLKEITFGLYKPTDRLSGTTDSRGVNKVLGVVSNNPLTTAGIATGGAAALKGVKVGASGISGAFQGSKAGVQALRAQQALKLTRGGRAVLSTGRLAKGGAIAAVETKGILAGFKGINQLGLNQEDKALIKSKDFQNRIKAIENAQRAQLNKGGANIPFTNKQFSTGGIAYEINPLLASRDQFKSIARQQGMSNKDISLALSQRSTMGIGEGTALLNVARFSERFGNKEVGKAFAQKGTKATKSAGMQTFKTTFSPIGRAGAIEGAISMQAQQDFRRQERNYKEMAAGAGIGFLSAGVLGGAIAGTKVAAKVKGKAGITSKALTGVSYVTDPFEFAGDKLAATQNRLLKKAGFNIVQPKISLPKVKTPTMTFGTTTQIGINTKSKSSTQSPINIKSPIQIQSPIQPKTNIPATIKTQAPIQPSVSIPVGVTSPIQTQSPINIQTNIPTNIPANVPINVNIPTVTPMFRIPPPIPLGFPAGSKGAGTGIGKRKTFKNELAISQNILANSFTVDFGFNKPVKKRSTKKKSKKKGKRKK